MRPADLSEVVGQQHLLAPRRAAAPPRRGLRRRVRRALRPARDRQDHPGLPHLRRHRSTLRGTVRAVGRRQGRAGRDRPGPSPPERRRADRALHRRGAPLLQDPAGRAARRGGEPDRAARGRHHRESVVLRRCPAAVPLPGAAAATAGPRRHPGPARAGPHRRTRPRWKRADHRRRARAPGAPRRWRRTPRADRPRGGRRDRPRPRRYGRDDRPADRRVEHRQGRGALRPRRRPALRRRERVHQVAARLRRRRRAALPRADDRRGGRTRGSSRGG